jgi:hypothetical protein
VASKGYLVIGPESSGTKLTAELLRRAGCRSVAIVGGDDGAALRLDGHPPLIRRSFPHGAEWPTVADLVSLLAVPDVQVVVTTRDWFAMTESQVNRRLAACREIAVGNIRRAYRDIFAGLSTLNLPFLVSSYEALTSQAGYPARLLGELGLRAATVETYAANNKWYGGEGAVTGPPPGAWTAGQF